MPELPESLRAQDAVNRKRKDAPGAPTEERGKRRKDNKASAKAVAPVKARKTKASGKSVKSAKKNAPPPISDDDMVSDEADAIDDPDVMEDPLDGVDITGLDVVGSASDSEELEDDEFDSDVVDSDTDRRRGGMFSDEDSDDDMAETLTQANIEGLSRRLDMEKAEEAARAEAELAEAQMSTNIAGDRPKILDDEDEEGRPITNLAAQGDLQTLRTRLTDTVRVLEDFKNLAEEGRSRQEYRQSMLQVNSLQSRKRATTFIIR